MDPDPALVVRNGRLSNRSEPIDIVVRRGEIIEISESSASNDPARSSKIETEVDAGGGLVTPGFVDGHMHLDMASAAESCPLHWNEEPLDPERFHTLMNEYYEAQTVSTLADAAERTIRKAVTNGTTHLRTHAMVDLEPGLDTLRALVDAKEATSHLADVQIVPYASRGILVGENDDLVREALELGLEEFGAEDLRLGGMDPASRNRAIERTLDRWFELATAYDVGLDVHLQDRGTTGAYVLDQLLDRIERHGYEGRVTASHSFCLGHLPEWRVAELAERLAIADVGVITCYTSTPVEMPLRMLKDAGVTVGHGTDNTHDFGFPHGTPNPLLAAFVEVIKLRGSAVRDANVGWYGTNPGLRLLWTLLTTGGASVLDLEEYELEVGSPATFLVLDRSTPEEAVLRRATLKCVFKDGYLVAENGEIVP